MTNSNSTSPVSEQKKISPRAAAYSVLLPFERDALKGTVNERHKVDALLQGMFNKYPSFSEQEKRFLNAVCYGILRHWFQLDAIIAWGLNGFSQDTQKLSQSKRKQALKSFDPRARLLIRLALFQAFWLDAVPDYAAVSSTLEIADTVKLPANFKKRVHAIVSNALKTEGIQEICKQVSPWPSAWSEMLAKSYEPNAVTAMLQSCNAVPSGLWIRVNTLKVSLDAYQEQLRHAGVVFEPTAAELNLPECLWLPEFSGSPMQLPGFQEGQVYIQDLSSAMVANWLDVKPGQIVLDLCAAPGSKTTHVAARMQNQGQIIALESSAKRIERLTENCARLGISCVESITADALTWQPESEQRFDRILVDAPCSGSGTIRRQPDVLLQWRASDASEYQSLQFSLLNRSAEWLKPGGILVYSTCSVDVAENQQVVEQFLQAHPDWSCESQYQQSISEKQDGFFGAVFKAANK